MSTAVRHRNVQRREAIERAIDVRSRRAKLKRSLKAGTQQPTIYLIAPPWWLHSMTLRALLEQLPFMGEVRTTVLCRRARVAPEATLANLTRHDAERLIRELDRRGK